MSTDVAPAAAPAVTANNDGVPPVHEGEAGFKVFAGNLAYATTDEGLRAFFGPVADDVISAHVILRGTRSAGYGFVTLSTITAVEKAVAELNKTDLDGRNVIIEVAKPADEKNKDRIQRKPTKNRFGRRGSKAVPGEVTEAEANGEVSDKIEAPDAEADAQAPVPARPKKAKKSKPRRRGPKTSDGEVAHEESASAPDVKVENGEPTLNGESPAAKKPKAKRVARPRAPRVPRAEGEAPVGEPSKNMLFVANLAFDVDDEGLANIFTSAGVEVVSARVVRRRWPPRRSKGYGFVDVGTEEEQKKAIELTQGKEIDGRAIAVKIAVNAAPHEHDDEAHSHEEAHEEVPDKKEAAPEDTVA